MTKYKLAVVGLDSSILIYRAIGADTFSVADSNEAKNTIEEVANKFSNTEDQTPEYAVIYVEEDFYKELPDDLLKKLTKRSLPALIPVPSPSSGKGESFAVKRLSKIVERAVGSDIFS
jgi:V/A-type H+-transporting ATPase subunit F